MIRVFICDDHPLIAQGLISYMESYSGLEVVAAVATAQELRESVTTIAFDVLLLDIQLPDGNGIELCGEIKQRYPEIKVLGLSNLDDRTIILQMINQGASGYLLKNAPMEEIIQAIEQIDAGGVYLGPGVQKALLSHHSNGLEEIPPITRREREVLKYLAAGLSSMEMAEKMFVSPLTIDAHRRNLLQKFKVNKTVNLLRKIKDLGIVV